MKRTSFFLCTIITFLVTICSVDKAKAFSFLQTDTKIEIAGTKLVYSVSKTSLPLNDSNNQTVPEIKAATSFSSLPSALSIHTDQEIICLFEIQYEVRQFENYQALISVSLSRLFLHLFRVIVSPNAP